MGTQSASIQYADALQAFQDSRNRIKSMALMHETLYQSQDLARVDIGRYILTEADHLFTACGGHARGVALNAQVDDVTLAIDSAVPCGLIINELATNGLRHAFPPGRDRETGEEDRIRIELRSESDGQLALIVGYNGVGLPPDLDLQDPSSFGLQLVSILAQQLKGTIDVDRAVGTAFEIRCAGGQS